MHIDIDRDRAIAIDHECMNAYMCSSSSFQLRIDIVDLEAIYELYAYPHESHLHQLTYLFIKILRDRAA